MNFRYLTDTRGISVVSNQILQILLNESCLLIPETFDKPTVYRPCKMCL